MKIIPILIGTKEGEEKLSFFLIFLDYAYLIQTVPTKEKILIPLFSLTSCFIPFPKKSE